MENSQTQKRRGGHGRRKVEITKIKKKSALATAFTKRRKGLFKKAAELCVLCGVEAAIVVFSPCLHKPYGFGHQSVDSVINRYLNENYASDLEKFWWVNEKIEELGIDELKECLNSMEERRKKFVDRVDQMEAAEMVAEMAAVGPCNGGDFSGFAFSFNG